MINSTSNKQVKNLIQLQKKGKARKEQDVFVVEGLKMYQEVPEEKLVVTYVSESFYGKDENRKLLGNRNHEVMTERVFDTVSDTRTPQGILCVVRQFHYSQEELLCHKKPFLMLLENIQDPGNLGTIIRTAEGAGANGILMTKETVDIYNPKTIRSTMGSIYRMPFLYIEDISEIMNQLKKHNIQTYAAHLEGKQNYYQENYQNGTVFLIGNEGNGLSKELAELADCYIKIPMHGKVESLNAGIASSVLMYEACRQRSENV